MKEKIIITIVFEQTPGASVNSYVAVGQITSSFERPIVAGERTKVFSRVLDDEEILKALKTITG